MHWTLVIVILITTSFCGLLGVYGCIQVFEGVVWGHGYILFFQYLPLIFCSIWWESCLAFGMFLLMRGNQSFSGFHRSLVFVILLVSFWLALRWQVPRGLLYLVMEAG
jgi:hypothetical protein